MGIKGLWSEVRPICRQSHLSSFRGQRVAVDMYVWLHRGIIGSIELNSEADAEVFVESAGAISEGGAEDGSSVRLNTKFLQFVVNRVELLLRCGIHPVFVFDGAPLPMKRDTEEDRRMHRAARIAEAVQILRDASTCNPRARMEATQLLERGMDITTELAHAVIQMLQERRLDCIVAPYEADAQLAYLCKKGYVQAVISEDSDLIAYHCPCLIAKLDGRGNCEVLSAQDLPRCPSFYGLSYESFLVGCILSGCDYLSSLRHIGVKKAFRLVAQATSVPSIMQMLEVKFGYSKEELRAYGSRLQQAFYCFAHHFVFDPARKEVLHLTPLPVGIPLKEDLLGELLPKDLAEKICGECMYDPITRVLYRGGYRYCVQQYWQQVRGGQALLNTFSGFQDMQSPRVTVQLGPHGTNPAERRSPSTTTVFSSPLQKLSEASGFCPNVPTRSRMVVRSKYFAKGRWKVEDWESESNDNTAGSSTGDSDCCRASSNSAAAAAIITNNTAENKNTIGGYVSPGNGSLLSSTVCTDDVGAPCGPNAIHFAAMKPDISSQETKMSSSSSPLPSSNLTVDSKLERGDSHGCHGPSATMSPLASSERALDTALPRCIDAAADANGSQSQGDGGGCPFRYTQCGRRHSIFEQCFQGKNWCREPKSCNKKVDSYGSSGIHTSETAGDNKNNTASRSPPRTEMPAGRQGETTPLNPPPPFRPVFKPPASTGERSRDASPCVEATVCVGKKKLMSSATQALQLMNQLTSGRLAVRPKGSQIQDGASTTPTGAAISSGVGDTNGKGRTMVAADILEKLAFARR